MKVLKRIDACKDAVKWFDGQEPAKAYRKCERADWLLWLAIEIGIKRELVVLAICKCWREIAKKHVPKGEIRPLKAIQAAEKWAKNSTEKNADAAYAAADAAEHQKMCAIIRKMIPYKFYVKAIAGGS